MAPPFTGFVTGLGGRYRAGPGAPGRRVFAGAAGRRTLASAMGCGRTAGAGPGVTASRRTGAATGSIGEGTWTTLAGGRAAAGLGQLW